MMGNELHNYSAPDADWERVKSEPGPDLIIFKARFDWLKNPRTPGPCELSSWKRPIGSTLWRSRQGGRSWWSASTALGWAGRRSRFPAGLLEAGETPEQAARRELEEETGCTTDRWTYLGWVEANPAFLNNRCHTFLAQDVVKTGAAHPDETEEIAVSELTLEEVRTEIAAGRMRNSLSIVSLARVFDMTLPW